MENELTALTADGASGAKLSELRYKPWGESRFGGVGTEYQYTGQYRESSLGLDWFNSRFYDPSLSRWAQPDGIVPLANQGAQAWDRYA